MIIQVLHGPHCQGTDIVRHGNTRQGKQRYRCRACRQGRGRTFLLDYSYAGQSPEIKEQIVKMAMNASGIRDTARVLHVSTNTVDVLPGMNTGASTSAAPSPIEGSGPAWVLLGSWALSPARPTPIPPRRERRGFSALLVTCTTKDRHHTPNGHERSPSRIHWSPRLQTPGAA
jgi:hypothetical protein